MTGETDVKASSHLVLRWFKPATSWTSFQRSANSALKSTKQVHTLWEIFLTAQELQTKHKCTYVTNTRRHTYWLILLTLTQCLSWHTCMYTLRIQGNNNPKQPLCKNIFQNSSRLKSMHVHPATLEEAKPSKRPLMGALIITYRIQ